MADFDPYYKWLAIPPAEQPPHYYRLLGLALFEPDLDVISSAADRQMAHIRSYQHGAQSQASQKILNELSNARLTLLRAESKTKYDTELRQRIAASLLRAKPLKVATPLAAPHAASPGSSPTPVVAQPIPQPLPRPAPQPGLIRPQPMPAAAQPQLRPELHSQPQSLPEAAEPGLSPQERRRLKQRNAMIRSVLGVFFGGIAGTYIAGLILNFLGAPVPEGVRFLPGLGKKVIASNPDNKISPRVTDDTNETNNPRRNIATNQAESADNPWQSGNFTPLQLGPGTHTLSWVESNGEFKIAFRQTHGTTSSPGTIPVGWATRISGAKVRKQENILSLSAAPGSFATFVLPIKAERGCVIEGGRLRISAALDANPGSVIQAMVSPDFNFNTWEKPNHPIAVFDAVLSQSVPQSPGIGGTFTAPRVKEVFFVIGMTVGSQASPGMPVIYVGHRQGDFGEIRIVRTDGSPPPPSVVVNQSPTASSGTAELLKVVPTSELQRQNYAKPQVAELMAEARRHVGSNDPGKWLEAASKSNNLNMVCALLTGAAEQAVIAGDVMLAAAAYQRLYSKFAYNFTTEEIQALRNLHQQNKPGFQPAAYAAWGVDVLDRIEKTEKTQPAYKDLAKRVYEVAVESGDRDLIYRATLHVAGASP